MKTILLVRHGKSSWEHDVIDAERPLKLRGKQDATLVAKHFMAISKPPERIFSSIAKRALNTCKIFTKTFNLSEDIIYKHEDLYDFSGENVIRFIKSLPREIDSVMIFGHNHAFTSIANLYGDKFISNLPTSGLVKLNFDIKEWKNLQQGSTEFIITPKQLKTDD
ncbi:histidine phosphatase family protein [uncultured Winogradskyella sp.]|uniref:SixA phosphatase family protein n=1 Tax=uncultured Winogradskyella sp. TaxID=395353 RepID=UPI0026039338|nr:histidine phosphatase family protein [uncultured Winogradskyella sp.]